MPPTLVKVTYMKVLGRSGGHLWSDLLVGSYPCRAKTDALTRYAVPTALEPLLGRLPSVEPKVLHKVGVALLGSLKKSLKN